MPRLDDHSFELLMSKLDSIEESQQRMYLQFNERMDRQDELFQSHLEDDKKLADNITAIGKEVTFAKGIAYVIGLGAAGTAWTNSWFK